MSEHTRPIRVVVFPTDETQPVTATIIDGSEAGLWRALDGDFEALFLPDLPGALYLNANSKSRPDFVLNARATRFVDAHIPGFAKADKIMGPAFCVGFDAEDWEADVHPDMEAAALAEQTLHATAPAWQRY